VKHLSNRRRTPEYSSYYHAKYRCTSPRCDKWAEYGGRGIEFRFKSFEEFFEVVGVRPQGTSLERIDGNGHYEPGNVCWASKSWQNKNRRRWRR
jgi:hypothetical protein